MPLKYLIRFEDTYGIADLYCFSACENFFDIKDAKKLISINDTTSIIFGLSNAGCLCIKRKELYIIEKFKPEYVITVMDLDKDNNDGTGILPLKTAKINLSETERKIKEISPNSKLRYIPTIYASETIMLYQYLKKPDKDFCIEEIVHCNNTWLFHSVIIAIFAHLEKLSDAKKVRNYLEIDKLLKEFQNTLKHYHTENKEIIRFILDRTYTGIELIQFLEKIKNIDQIFKKYIHVALPFEICGISVTSNDNLFSKKELFPHFPSSYR